MIKASQKDSWSTRVLFAASNTSRLSTWTVGKLARRRSAARAVSSGSGLASFRVDGHVELLENLSAQQQGA